MNKPPVFIVSTGRSGSQMLSHLLANHPVIFSTHEPKPHLVSEAYALWKGKVNKERIVQRILSKRSSFLKQVKGNHLLYVESSHYCAHLIPILHDLFDARFIHLYRDGRSFVRSGLERESWYPHTSFSPVGWGKKYIAEKIRRKYFLNFGNIWDDHRLEPPSEMTTRIEKITWLWTEINKIIIRDLETIPSDRYMNVALEEINRDAIIRILDFIGAAPINLDKMIETMNKKPNKTKEHSIPHFEDWSENDQNIFWKIAQDTMGKLNYH